VEADFLTVSPDQVPNWGNFNVITCMMGTFNHFELNSHLSVALRMYEALAVNGLCAISMWNPDCEHLDFLTMYSDSDKQSLRNNLVKTSEASKLLSEAGFIDVRVVPYCLLPGEVLVDLAGDFRDAAEMRLPALVDLAYLSQYGYAEGELYLLLGRKGSPGN